MKEQLFVMQAAVQPMTLRVHALAIHTQSMNITLRQRFFANRVIDKRNALPDLIISLVTKPLSFRVALQQHTFRYSIELQYHQLLSKTNIQRLCMRHYI
jgi:hypothetical protein